MRQNSVIYLLTQTDGSNDIGDAVTNPDEKRKVFAERASVRQSEFYQAANTSFKPEITFKIWANLYRNEESLEYQNKKYTIIRTFQKDLKEIELVCSRWRPD